MDDLSWIDDWGMDDTFMNNFDGDFSTLFSGDDLSWIDDWGMDPTWFDGNFNGDLSDYWNGLFNDTTGTTDISSLINSIGGLVSGAGSYSGTLGRLLNSAANTQTTGNSFIDALAGLYGLYNNVNQLGQNQDYLDALSDSTDQYSSLLNKYVKNYSPYSGDLTADLDPAQQAAAAAGQGIVDTATPLYSQGAEILSGTGAYDPAKMQQHLNPYLEGALNSMATMTNRNLTENLLPNVNSTFIGNGQFGSTRNADFTNRAIRDTQDTIANTGASMINSAYNNAATDYLNWDRQGQSTGTSLGQYSLNGIQSGSALGGLNQTQQQTELTNAYNQWLQNQKLPIEQYKTLASGIGGLLPPSMQSPAGA